VACAAVTQAWRFSEATAATARRWPPSATRLRARGPSASARASPTTDVDDEDFPIDRRSSRWQRRRRSRSCPVLHPAAVGSPASRRRAIVPNIVSSPAASPCRLTTVRWDCMLGPRLNDCVDVVEGPPLNGRRPSLTPTTATMTGCERHCCSATSTSTYTTTTKRHRRRPPQTHSHRRLANTTASIVIVWRCDCAHLQPSTQYNSHRRTQAMDHSRRPSHHFPSHLSVPPSTKRPIPYKTQLGVWRDLKSHLVECCTVKNIRRCTDNSVHKNYGRNLKQLNSISVHFWWLHKAIRQCVISYTGLKIIALLDFSSVLTDTVNRCRRRAHAVDGHSTPSPSIQCYILRLSPRSPTFEPQNASWWQKITVMGPVIQLPDIVD